MTATRYLVAITTAILTTTLLADEEAKPCHPKYQQFTEHTMCLPKSPNARTIEMSDEWKKRIIDHHNHNRIAVEPPAATMMKMRWDPELEEMAQRWADACEFRGGLGAGLRHDRQRFIPGSMFIGQSMSSTTIDFDIAMTYWWLESRNYTFGLDYREQMFEGKCGFSVGHYTQMVWADSYLVGCAASTCYNKDTVIVCNYGPTGNRLPFTTPYEEGPRCSKCQTCVDGGLCDCGDLNCHGGRLDPSTCTCDCMLVVDQIVPEFIMGPDCRLNCSGRDLPYCGYDPFHKCSDDWTAKKCPHMCNVCPYAEDGYIPESSNSSSSDNNGTSSSDDNGTDSTSVVNGTSTDGTPTINGASTVNGASNANSTSSDNATTLNSSLPANSTSNGNGTFPVNGTDVTPIADLSHASDLS